MKSHFEEPVVRVDVFCLKDIVTASGFNVDLQEDETILQAISGRAITPNT